MVEMEVEGVKLEVPANTPVLMLREVGGERRFDEDRRRREDGEEGFDVALLPPLAEGIDQRAPEGAGRVGNGVCGRHGA